MGCNIHVHTELLINEKWEHYTNPNVPRNYELYEKMAGVRGDLNNAFVAPRGLPENCSIVTQIAWSDRADDYHTPSWFMWQEIALLQAWFEKRYDRTKVDFELNYFGFLFGNAWMSENLPFEVQDFRFVFWFDN